MKVRGAKSREDNSDGGIEGKLKEFVFKPRKSMRKGCCSFVECFLMCSALELFIVCVKKRKETFTFRNDVRRKNDCGLRFLMQREEQRNSIL